MNAAASNRTYYPALDGLRGIAILLVILLHNFKYTNYFFFGWLGVDLFFVLSGFLITDILLRTVGEKKFLQNFYIRRILRIFPIYYLTIVICLFIIPSLGAQLRLDYYINNQFAFWTFTQNWLFIFKSPSGDPILMHFWSLAVEEQFYILWPIIILTVRKHKSLLFISVSFLLLIMVIRVLLWKFHIEDLAYDSLYTFTRIDGICVGCSIALLLRVYPLFLKNYRYLIVLFLAAINFIIYFLNLRSGSRLPYLAFVGYTTFAVLFGILVYEVITNRSKWIKICFENKILMFFGKISYGFYVYHWPVYLLLFPYFRDLLINEASWGKNAAQFISAVTATLVSLGLSVLSRNYFESYFLRLKKRYSG
jgi:peptidoglycan/LPS O-acetylase OafA/YrhL